MNKENEMSNLDISMIIGPFFVLFVLVSSIEGLFLIAMAVGSYFVYFCLFLHDVCTSSRNKESKHEKKDRREK